MGQAKTAAREIPGWIWCNIEGEKLGELAHGRIHDLRVRFGDPVHGGARGGGTRREDELKHRSLVIPLKNREEGSLDHTDSKFLLSLPAHTTPHNVHVSGVDGRGGAGLRCGTVRCGAVRFDLYSLHDSLMSA